MKRIAVVLLAFLVSGCAESVKLTGNPAVDVPAVESALNKKAVPDLQAAAADATAHGNTAAAMCWSGLVPIAQSFSTAAPAPGAPVPPAPGPALIFQKLVDTVQVAQGGGSMAAPILEKINLACGAFYVQLRIGVAKMAVDIMGLVSGTSPALGILKGAAGGVGAAVNAAGGLP